MLHEASSKIQVISHVHFVLVLNTKASASVSAFPYSLPNLHLACRRPFRAIFQAEITNFYPVELEL